MKFAMTALAGVAAVVTSSGCAAINRTRPGDMTIPEHEAAAAMDARQSEAAAARATTATRTGPNEQFSAERHRRLAKEHAAAAEQRRAEVAAACAGVEAPLRLAEAKVERVVAIREKDPRANGRGYFPERIKGARIAIATSAEEAPIVARALACEAARESAGLGEAVPRSPFAVRSAAVTAAPASSGVRLEIRSDDESDAVEVLERAEALACRAAR